jgi:hypothetical protein
MEKRKGLHWIDEDTKAIQKYVEDLKSGKIETVRLEGNINKFFGRNA